MRNKQYKDNGVIRLTKRIWTNILIKENKILIKKKRNESCYKFKEVKTEIIVFNIYKTWKTIVYKELSRRLIS